MAKAVPVPTHVGLEVVARARYGCEWCHLNGDSARAGDGEIHHRITRSRARNLHDPWNCVLLCKTHHDRAHAENTWPWLVPGYTLRGRYVGPDPLYHALYNGALLPTKAEIREFFPDATPAEIEWALSRALWARNLL